MTSPSFYERMLARVAGGRDIPEAPAERERFLRSGIRDLFLRPPAPELEEAAFLLGEWETGGEVYATPTTPGFGGASPGRFRWTRTLRGHALKCTESGGEEGAGSVNYLYVDPDSKLWVNQSLEANVAATCRTASGWRDGRLEFVGEIAISGDVATWRHTLVRVSDDEYRWENEELLSDGSWLPIDHHWYRRIG